MKNQIRLPLLCLAIGVSLSLQAQTVHIETNSGVIEKETTSLKKLQQRVVDAEHQVSELIKASRLASCPRIVVYDWATASDQAEHDAISEGGLIMLLAITKDPEELPLKLAYIDRGEDKPMRLVKIGQLPLDLVRKLKFIGPIGANAWAGLYWVPAIRQIKGKILVDFSKNREDFSIGLSLPPGPEMFKGLTDHLTQFPGVPNSAVKSMAEREFPGFEFDKEYLDYLQRQNSQAH